MTDVVRALREAFDREQAEAAPAFAAADLPLSYESISDAWLTKTICRDHPGAAVRSHRLGAIDEGNTSRRRIHLEYNAAGDEAGLPRTVFCKASHNFATRVSVGICGGLQGEVTFYNEIRPLLDFEAPSGVWANINPTTLNSIIMLHDLGPETEFCTLATDMTDDRLRGQMALLARLHTSFSGGVDRAEALAALPTWPDFFDRASLMGFERICDRGFLAAEAVIPPALFRRRPEVWPATLTAVARHRSLPRVLLHSDTHLRNWYIAHTGKVGLHDWQGVCKGHWSRDVAYTIVSAMAVERRRHRAKDLLGYYLGQLQRNGGPQIAFDEAWMHFRRELFPALAYWTVTMPSPELPNMQPVDSTLELIRRIAAAIEEEKALDG